MLMGLKKMKFIYMDHFLLNKLPIYTEWDYFIQNLPQEISDRYLSNRQKLEYRLMESRLIRKIKKISRNRNRT